MRTGPDRSSDHGPKTVKTGPKTGPRTDFAGTDPTLDFTFLTSSIIRAILTLISSVPIFLRNFIFKKPNISPQLFNIILR